MNTQQALKVWLKDESLRWTPPPALLVDVIAIPHARGTSLSRTARVFFVAAAAAALTLAFAAGVIFVGGRSVNPGPTPGPTSIATSPASPSGTVKPASLVPSGQYRPGQVAFVIGDDVFVANADGSDQRRITNSAATGFSFGLFEGPNYPNPSTWFGDRILVLGWRQADDTDSLQLINLAGGTSIELARFTGLLSYLDVAATPDGSMFAVETDESLSFISDHGSVSATVELPDGYDRWGVTDVSSLSWSTDGGLLSVTACTARCQKRGDPGLENTFVVDVRATIPKPIPVSVDRLPGWNAQISPDGQRLAYEVVPEQGWPGSRIWLINRDGSNAHQLDTPAASRIGGWSPDGAHLAFVEDSQTAGLPATVGVIDVDTGSYSTYQLDPEATFEDWSPDGGDLSFVTSTSDNLVRLMTLPNDLQSTTGVLDVGATQFLGASWQWVANDN